jgi:hypothetical protein
MTALLVYVETVADIACQHCLPFTVVRVLLRRFQIRKKALTIFQKIHYDVIFNFLRALF